jgi:hypothetical protein
VTRSAFHSASPLPGWVPSAGAISRARCTVAPAPAAARAVWSAESESMTTISSISGARAMRALRIAVTTPPTVCSSFRAGITTLIRAPIRSLASSSRSSGQSRQCDVRRSNHSRARSCMPG